ncbi:MAG: enoyl-CoA hydratase/carnithine racemase [Halobacteriales archaeon]|jgi:enoyl-CoA hydratase/carnithine racemase
MTYETVETDREGYVGIVTLDRPESMNTFSTGLAVDLDEALREFEDDQEVRAIVVDGAGRAFSAGIDVSEHGDFETEAEYEEWVSKMEEPFVTLRNMETPVIAAAHGHAAANGVGLVAACDLAVVAEGTQLGATAPKVGLFCMGPAVPLRRNLPDKRTLELILTGKLIDAETARDWGLINEVVSEDELDEAAMELANEIASKSPVAIRMGKAAYNEMADMGYEEALEYSNERFAALCATADAEAGIAAFLEGDPLDGDEWPGE